MANEGGMAHTRVALMYMAAQAVVTAGKGAGVQAAVAAGVLAVLAGVYVVVKGRLAGAGSGGGVIWHQEGGQTGEGG